MRPWLGTLRWTWPVLLAAVVLLLPWACHRVAPTRELDVVVVDKTVPYANWREHRPLFWLLDHRKIVRPGGGTYDPSFDYVGTTPGPTPGDRPARTRDLRAADVVDADLLYLADTYGVYVGDLESGDAMRTALDRTPKIYGGLTEEEARAAVSVPARGGTLVAEFNTFASPTGAAAVETICDVLGVRWTRWIGRYFPRLEDTDEVPPWMRDNWEREWDDAWTFQGPGFVLLYEDAHVEVLEVGVHARTRGLRVERETPVDPLLRDARDATYPFWFDVVDVEDGTDVLAWYRWDLTDAGRERLAARGLPTSFPAVTRRFAPGGGVAYYFAGDFVDSPIGFAPMPFAGYLGFKRRFEALRFAPSDAEFYWRFYAPMMTRLLDDVVERRGSRGVLDHGSR